MRAPKKPGALRERESQVRGCGHKSIQETEQRHFKDKRSYVSTRYTPEGRSLEFLYGQDWKIRTIEMLERDNYTCQDCGARYNLDPDHILERSKGGDDCLYNLTTRCRACHDKRHGRQPRFSKQWYASGREETKR